MRPAFAVLFAAFALAAPGSARQAAGARPEIRAVWVDPAKLAIDGDPSEWRRGLDPTFAIERADQLVELSGRNPRELWSGPDDASVKAWLGWNANDLVIYGEVYDEVASYDATRWFRGDSLELFLDLEDWGPQWGPDDYQIMLAPDWSERPWGVYPRAEQTLAGDEPSDGGFGGVEIVSIPFIGGYRFEARLPWSNFHRYQARDGARIGFNFAFCDRDHRGNLETYGTWTGESEIAQHADRRGILTLSARDPGVAPATLPSQTTGTSRNRSYLLVALAALYGLSLWSRRVWRSKRARRIGLRVGTIVVALAGATAFAAHVSRDRAVEARRTDMETYWASFSRLLASGVFAHEEPAQVLREAETLLGGRAIPARPGHALIALAPAGATLGGQQRTPRRGLPFAPIEAPGRAPMTGVPLDYHESLSFPLPPDTTLDGVQIVTRVSDPRMQRMTTRQLPILSIEVRREGRSVAPAMEVRDLQDLHFDDDPHGERAGLEPAFYVVGGRRGRLHGDALTLELWSAVAADELVVRFVGPTSSYVVQIVAVSARTPTAVSVEPPDTRRTSEGQWLWTPARGSIEAEVTALGRTPKKSTADQVSYPLQLADEPLGMVHLRDVAPPPATGWDTVPLGTLAALAPFLVAMFAEWLATRRRIRGKLAVGFAVTSAVPLLALTLLLEASLRAEHRARELERTQESLVRAEKDLEGEARELEQEALRLLKIAELKKRLEGSFPETGEELSAWWGESDAAVRLFERTNNEGRKIRVGTGPQWRQIPKGVALETGLSRPWGQLFVFGVAHTAPGAEQPLTVAIARTPGLPGLVNSARGAVGDVRLLGAVRDPAPVAADLVATSDDEVRRAVYDPSGQVLVGVFVAALRDRGVPVLGDFTLTELLLAAGITAVFTVLLFAGILTGHLVGPIERLDRAVRAGTLGDVLPEVEDEIGHLTSAIRSYSSEVAERVHELETLQLAQGELSRRLDPDQAREAVLAFFADHSSAISAWILWRGEAGEEARVFGASGRDLALPEEAGALQHALVAGEVVHLSTMGEKDALSEFERALLGAAERLLCLPLIAAGETRGAVVLGYPTDAPRTDLTFLIAAASQSAIVLENARLYRQAVRDAVTGFLSDPGFRQRVAEEIQRAQGEPEAGVLLIQIRLSGLPRDDERAGERLREAARRIRLAVRGLAVFGRAGAADLKIALPWSANPPSLESVARRLVDRVTAGPWPDGEAVTGVYVAHAAWPSDGPSARFVLSVLEERLAEAQTGVPAAQLVKLAPHLPVDFVAVSPLMIQLLETLRRIAEQEITVLVAGETGAGKDRIAELIHKWSRRASGPLVHIHCPSLSTSLIEDELFGHAKGAFTGAHVRRVGPFEYAAGGTVVLDEIGGMPPAGQVALLRLLETREVVPLGATKALPIDVRIVATSSKDLAAEVERGTFRGDLYFRLNVAQVTVPPLRLRRQALPELVDAFLRRFNASADRPVTGVDSKVMDALFEHDWPGNLRELENVLAKGCVLAAGGELGPEHLDLATESDVGVSAEAVVEGALSERQERLVDVLAPGARISSAEFAGQERTSSRTALRDLLDLVDKGFLVREGSRRGTRFRRTSKALAG